MVLYHGSNMAVERPELRKSRKAIDFGEGFYTTSDFEQAAKWARRVAFLRHKGESLVSSFEVDEGLWDELAMLRFEVPDIEWLDFVAENRKLKYSGREWDVISGPVANDRTEDVINLYIEGFYTAEIALQLLLPQKLTDQTSLKTDRALKAIKFKEVVRV